MGSCVNMVIFVSLNPSFSYVFAGSKMGGSVPGYTGIVLSIIWVKSITFILNTPLQIPSSYAPCSSQILYIESMRSGFSISYHTIFNKVCQE